MAKIIAFYHQDDPKFAEQISELVVCNADKTVKYLNPRYFKPESYDNPKVGEGDIVICRSDFPVVLDFYAQSGAEIITEEAEDGGDSNN